MTEPVKERVHKPAREAAPQCFSLRELPLLQTGMTTTAMAHADNLWVHGKIYSQGGENSMHAHRVEDHVFFILHGSALFEFGDGSRREIRELEGVLLPKGVLYNFHSTGVDNLVMLRVGAAQIGADWSGVFRRGVPEETRSAVNPEGEPLKSGSRAKGRTPAELVKVLEGRFVGDYCRS